VADAFLQNARRLVRLQHMPFFLTHAVRLLEAAKAGALMKLTDSIQPIDEDHPRADDVHELEVKLYQSLGQEGDHKRMMADTQIRALEVLKLLSATGKSEVIDGMEAILAAMLVNTWTAFETLSGDLWEAALTCHPKTLSELSGGKSKETSGKDDRAIPLILLQKYEFDLSTAMGTILKERNIRFDKLEDIRQNYARAFRDDSVVAEVLSDPSLDSLSAVRNLFVHRAGVVDQKYLNRTKNLPNVPSAAIGEPILLDGEIVSKLTRPVMLRGIALLTAVDDWLAQN
jgi:hypothetical protein